MSQRWTSEKVSIVCKFFELRKLRNERWFWIDYHFQLLIALFGSQSVQFHTKKKSHFTCAAALRFNCDFQHLRKCRNPIKKLSSIENMPPTIQVSSFFRLDRKCSLHFGAFNLDSIQSLRKFSHSTKDFIQIHIEFTAYFQQSMKPQKICLPWFLVCAFVSVSRFCSWFRLSTGINIERFRYIHK